ncbi:MAG: rhomboid family intramembrane serine protease [Halobacteriales archaeon]
MTVVPPWIGRAGFVVAAVGIVLAVQWLDRRRDWGRRRRERFVLGVPWGTLLIAGFVLGIYLFIQGGLEHWHRPAVIPFRSWSYLYPLGTLASGFTHSGSGHLTGNLIGTLVFGTIAEYAWSHFPRDRGTTVGSSLRTNPYARAFLIFPAGVIGVGILTGVFSLGPTIGFSGVVFALGGFALTRFPIGTVLGLLASDAVSLTYNALRNPVATASRGPGFGGPWWAGISIQGHLLGLLVGVALGLLVFRRRSTRPDALRLWGGALLFVIGENLWALWWYRGGNEFVLFRALGMGFVLLLSFLIAVALVARDRRMPAWLTRRRASGAGAAAVALGGVIWWLAGVPGSSLTLRAPGGSVPVVAVGFAVAFAVLAVAATLARERPLFPGRSRRELAQLGILIPLVLTAAVTIPTNLMTVDDAESPGNTTIEVRDYDITYAENVQNQMVNVVDVSLLGETTQVTTSGVIVISESRHIWKRTISTARLKFTGLTAVEVGGIGWRHRVFARRNGWSAAGGGAAYRVFLRRGGADEWRLAYTSDRAVASPRLRNRSVGITPTEGGFAVELLNNESAVASGPIPRNNESVTLSGITFVHEDKNLFATFNGTRIKVGSEESYN